MTINVKQARDELGPLAAELRADGDRASALEIERIIKQCLTMGPRKKRVATVGVEPLTPYLFRKIKRLIREETSLFNIIMATRVSQGRVTDVSSGAITLKGEQLYRKDPDGELIPLRRTK